MNCVPPELHLIRPSDGFAHCLSATGKMPVAPVSRQDGGSPYGRGKRGRGWSQCPPPPGLGSPVSCQRAGSRIAVAGQVRGRESFVL